MGTWMSMAAWAQEGRPEAEEPPVIVEEEIVEVDSLPTDAEEALIEAEEAAELENVVVWSTDSIRTDRRPVKDEAVVLALKEVKLEDLIEFIAYETGKVVMPIKLQTAGAASRNTYDIVADRPMKRVEALDFIFTYLRMHDIGIIERPKVIFIGKLDEMVAQLGEIEVVSADERIADRTDRGTLIFKIFQIENTDAGQIKDDLSDFFPDVWARMREDDLSNQILVLGDVGLCQQIEKIIKDIDRKWLRPEIRTFRLEYADAREIETNILELFEQAGGSGSSSAQRRTTGNRTSNRTNRSTTGTTTSSEGVPEAELRMTVNEQQNTVTVQGETKTVDEIATLILTQWDLPRPDGTSRLFILKYTDPVKVKELLSSVLGGGSSSSSGASRARTGGANQNQRTDATVGVAGVYQFESFPDRNALLVLAKTEESFSFIESVIETIDKPTDAGLPEIIPLKYADAVSLTEELNVLLARAGGRASLPRPSSGLTAGGFSDGDSSLGVSGPETGETSSDLQFPWANTPSNEEQSPESALIGKVRIVPIVRQNAIAILAPPAYQEPMRKLIEAFDQPQRQVMLSATVVEIDLGDDLNLGMKLGKNQTGGIGALVDGAIGVNFAAQEFLLDLFGASNQGTSNFTLGDYSINVIIEALNTITNTRIIQEPRVFTADNQEAVFFSGQEFPVATGVVDSASGGLNTSTTIDYRNIGVFLNVRPRITEEGAVDLTVSVELSDVADPNFKVGTTESAIFGRKQVTTHAVLLDGQTIVLGGLLKESELISRDRIPLLADIPIIGQFFEFNNESLQRTELVVFVTPTVVHRPVDNYSNFNVQDLERLDDIARPLAEQLAESQRAIDSNIHRRMTKQPYDS
ncbi:MAG: hypothetical protein MK100_06755, partial [Phycisphaerales bacterium]|nr:hypothetical protein [Phycisphaerales bacterium]